MDTKTFVEPTKVAVCIACRRVYVGNAVHRVVDEGCSCMEPGSIVLGVFSPESGQEVVREKLLEIETRGGVVMTPDDVKRVVKALNLAVQDFVLWVEERMGEMTPEMMEVRIRQCLAKNMVEWLNGHDPGELLEGLLMIRADEPVIE